MESRAGGTADAGHHRDRREDPNDPQHEMSFGTCKRGIEALGGFAFCGWSKRSLRAYSSASVGLEKRFLGPT